MALKPKDLRLTEEELRRATTLEVEIDEKLEKLFRPGKTEYRIDLGTDPTARVAAELVRRYTTGEGAWSYAEYHSFKFLLRA